MADTPSCYYYANGQRVLLERRPDVASATLGRPARDGADGLPGLLPALLPAHLPAHLPAYSAAGAQLVALPEVRVEDADEAALARVAAWLQQEPAAGEVLATRPGRLTLRPGAALRGDSVAMAREAVERCGVASASPRFLRLTKKPA
jgi:hypothetical protein